MKKIKVELTHAEIVGVMRSLSRSLQSTPEKEKVLHKLLWMKFGEWHVQTLPPGVVEDIGRIVDGAIGR